MQQKNNTTAIVIIASLFFIFGFVTGINGALIPFMKTINELTDAQFYLVALASYISFVVMALFVSILFMAALGIANALVWYAIYSLTLEGLGKFTKIRSVLLVMTISGGAIIPPLYGRIVDGNK